MPNKQPLEWENDFEKNFVLRLSNGYTEIDSAECDFETPEKIKSFIRTVREEAIKETMERVMGCLPEECPADYNGYDMFNECRSQFLSNLKSKELI